MSLAAQPAPGRLPRWCGWVMVFAAVMTPLLAWLGPLGFAPLLALLGLLCLPAIRLDDADRPALVALAAALVWAAISTLWSPHAPRDPGSSTALKLALELPLYWAAVCGARRADPALQRLALRVLAWGLAALGALLIVEAFTGGQIYRALHIAFYEPIRPDLAGKNLGQAAFVLALLWPLAAAGGVRAGAIPGLALPMAAGVAVAGVAFRADAPLLALALGGLAGFAVWRAPREAPKAIAGVAALFFVAMPVAVWAIRDIAAATSLDLGLPLSWAQRLSYWSHAVDWIAEHPLRGWGLDASRMFGPGIQLHPHNSALQLWLELGVAGAAAAAVFWGATLLRLKRTEPSLAMAATAASVAAYLLFGAANFGVWQEWWLALGALVAVLVAMLTGDAAPQPAAKLRRSAAQASTFAPISE
ncbi:O-antigen ligase family protein [Phenylobacterium sp.]|uniref:O-antigen ligase family protein n=1 Tax=Phenylobacterium sp. TaxID=1871053 RepID=UPI0039831E79